MSRFTDLRRRWCLPWVLCVVLAGCATTQPQRPPLDAAGQQAVLLQLQDFSLAGRAALPTGSASVDWQQQADVSKVKLSGPLGVGSLQLEYSAARLRLQSSRGLRLVDDEAEQVLVRELGFVPPFDALRYWIRGLPAPGDAAAQETRDADGMLQELQQQGWHVRYDRRVTVNTRAGALQLPQKLTATRDALQLKLVIDRWRIK
jgi:outer membrane lipoprotein LolB